MCRLEDTLGPGNVQVVCSWLTVTDNLGASLYYNEGVYVDHFFSVSGPLKIICLQLQFHIPG